MHGLIISNACALQASVQTQMNKGLNILPNFHQLIVYNHTVDSIMRQSSNYNYAKVLVHKDIGKIMIILGNIV